MRRRLAWIFAAVVLLATVGAVASATPIVPNDPLLPSQDGTDSHPARLGQWALTQIEVGEAWNVTRGAGVVIAIVDDGVDLDHPDLENTDPNRRRVLPGRTIPCTWARQPCDGRWLPSEDALAVPDHGTHVAGVAAGIANNGIGIAGVAPEARILPVNVFQDSGAAEADVAEGIRWSAEDGAHVINLSLGDAVPVFAFFEAPDDPIPSAIAYAIQRGAVVVIAAGNSTWPICESPSSTPGAICVAATDAEGNPADYSSLPRKNDRLALRAPGGGTVDYETSCGGGIVSTVPEGFGDDARSGCYPDAKTPTGSFAEHVGTSMAAPHVAGVAALVRSLGCDAATTVDILVHTAHNPRTPGGYDDIWGWGIVNAKDAVAAARQRCAPPPA